jgi:hypothetical protein
MERVSERPESRSANRLGKSFVRIGRAGKHKVTCILPSRAQPCETLTLKHSPSMQSFNVLLITYIKTRNTDFEIPLRLRAQVASLI